MKFGRRSETTDRRKDYAGVSCSRLSAVRRLKTDEPWRSSAPSACPTRCPRSRARAWCCARRRCPTLPNGRRCARRAAISSRRGSRPGRPTTSRARRSAAASSAIRGPAQRPRLCVLRLPQARRRAGRRAHARQYPARLRAGRQPRLLDGRGLCAAGLHDGGGQRRHPVRVRRRCGCTGSRPPASPPMWRRSGCWRRPASGARALPGNICASTGSGRTTCCMPASRTTRPEGGSQARRDQRAPPKAMGLPRFALL